VVGSLCRVENALGEYDWGCLLLVCGIGVVMVVVLELWLWLVWIYGR